MVWSPNKCWQQICIRVARCGHFARKYATRRPNQKFKPTNLASKCQKITILGCRKTSDSIECEKYILFKPKCVLSLQRGFVSDRSTATNLFEITVSALVAMVSTYTPHIGGQYRTILNPTFSSAVYVHRTKYPSQCISRCFSSRLFLLRCSTYTLARTQLTHTTLHIQLRKNVPSQRTQNIRRNKKIVVFNEDRIVILYKRSYPPPSAPRSENW